MKWNLTLLNLVFICCNSSIAFTQNITIDDTKTAQYLVNNILVNSSCATVSNFTASGDNVNPGKNSYAYFNNPGTNFPFSEGVLLSTARADYSVGPYIFDNGNNGHWSGDTDLDKLLGIHSVTATTLEFDFTPLTNFLSFDYIFASTEYADTGSCKYTDGFAFLIKENITGSTYENIAVIPGTNTPVSSTNIHPTIANYGTYSGCEAINETYFYKFNNDLSAINYAGQTVVLTAKTSVFAGKSYHIKLVIANDKNEYYDSAVFLKAGSFAPKINLGPDRLAANSICFGESFTIDTQLPVTYTYKWYKNGSLTPIPGETKPSLTIIEPGTYNVEVIFSPATCNATGKITIEYTPEIVLSNTSLTQCKNNPITIFDLTKVDNIIKNNNSSLSPVIYYENLLDAQTKMNEIQDPKSYTYKPDILKLFARVTNAFGCSNYAQIDLLIANNSLIIPNPISTCDTDNTQDGLYRFDLNTQVTPQILANLPSKSVIEYYLNTSDACTQQNLLPNLFKNTIANQQTIQARIVNGPDCYGIIPITLLINTFDPAEFKDETLFICKNEIINLSVATGFFSYLWNTGASTNTITITTSGDYSVTVTSLDGCEKTKKIKVISSEIATITGATITDFIGNNNSILLNYTGLGDYEFSLDGFNFQDSPLFTGIAPGKYWAHIRDKNGCGTATPFIVYVLDYPRFFTPNGDGNNDLWKIKNIDLFPKATLSIYDRYGKLLKQIQSNTSSGWNGKYIGRELPAEDYWFELNFGDGRIIKGHFSLIR